MLGSKKEGDEMHTQKTSFFSNTDNFEVLYHASNTIVKFPEVRCSKYTKDFSWGFYCTKLRKQAQRWAQRFTGESIINIYEYRPNSSLAILEFDKMSDNWLDFIAQCRSGKIHSYDIVEGPMADDTIWNYVNDYLNGVITKEQFWALAAFKHPTHQISFHTLNALSCLKYAGSEVLT